MKPRGNSVATQNRRRDVEAMMAMLIGTRRIQEDVSVKHNVTKRTVRSDILWVHKQWDEEALANRPSRRNQMRQMLEKLVQKSMAAKDWKAATGACDRLMKLDGLNAPLQIEATTKITHRVELMTSDQQRKALFSMVKRLSSSNGKSEESEAIEVPTNGSGNGSAVTH